MRFGRQARLAEPVEMIAMPIVLIDCIEPDSILSLVIVEINRDVCVARYLQKSSVATCHDSKSASG